MAGGGFGSIDSMIKTIKNNANLLRRKSMFDVLKESGNYKKKKPYEYKKASKQDLIDINERMRLRNKRILIKQIFIFSLIAIILSYLLYIFIFTPTEKVSTLGKPLIRDYYSTQIRPLGSNLEVKIEYFDMSNIAAETKLKNGYKHQQSESYYPNGKQFRSAVYWYDTLVKEFYFSPEGDTINHSSKWSEKSPTFIRLTDYGQSDYTFYISEGKIIPNTFEISTQ